MHIMCANATASSQRIEADSAGMFALLQQPLTAISLTYIR